MRPNRAEARRTMCLELKAPPPLKGFTKAKLKQRYAKPRDCKSIIAGD